MKRLRTSLVLACVGLAIGLTACGGFAEDAGELSYCVQDADCSDPFICVFGACYDPADAAFQKVSFEVVPPSLSRLPTQQFRDFVVSGQSRSDVVLAPSVEAHFQVLEGAGAALPGLVTAETQNEIPGRPLRVDEQTSSDGRGVLGLVSGRSYSLRVLPNDEDKVPFRPPTIFANSDIDGPSNALSLTSPGSGDLHAISGRTVVSASDSSGIPDLRVQVLGLVGTPAEMRVVSNTGRSQEQGGGFSVDIPKDFNSNLTLRIGPTEANPFFPVVQVTGLDITGDTDLGLVEVGAVGSPLAVSGTFIGPAAPESAATVTFVGEVGAGTYTASAVTQADGTFELFLLWGSYQAVASPPASSRAALTELVEPFIIDLPPSGTTTVEFAALPRATLSGEVRLGGEVAVAGATVRASRLGNAMEVPGPGDAVRTAFEARTDLNGRYEMRVDPGRYELAVIPPRDVIAPRRTDIIVVGVTDLLYDVALHEPAPFGGRVLTESDAAAVPGALVRAYMILPDQRIMLVGEEMTEANGEFNLVLPLFQRDQD